MSPRLRLGAILVAVAGGLMVVGAAMSSDSDPKVRVCIATNEGGEFDAHFVPASGGWPASQRIAHDWGVDAEFGVEIELVPRVTGKGTLETLLDNNADIANVAARPLVEAIGRGEDVLILALTERSDRQVRLVARAEHVDDWIDYPIGEVPGTVLDSALIAEIDQSGRIDAMRDGSIDLVGARQPLVLMNSLIEGSISSAMLLQPHAALLTETGDTNTAPAFVDVTTPNLYEFDSFLVTTSKRWEAHRDSILLALRATRETRQMIQADPDRRLRMIHNIEAGETGLRDLRPWFWEADEVVFIADRRQITDALTREATLLVHGGIIDSIPSFEGALTATDTVAELA